MRYSSQQLEQAIPLLGGLSPAQFMRDYWQQKPLLIRHAFNVDAGWQSPVSVEELLALALEEDVQARLIQRKRGQYKLTHPPLESLPKTTEREWTVLVQGVNLYHDAANQLLEQFCFVPAARLDDVMISYATDGGGVGAHVDSYDVFLLQGVGQRRWRIGPVDEVKLVPDAPLKLLAQFEPTEEFVLNPGDMLYVPPGYGHDGVAVGECVTLSIGFRAPQWKELGQAFLQDFARQHIQTKLAEGLYADAHTSPTDQPAVVPEHMVDAVAQALKQITWSRDDVALFLARYLSEPKPHVYFDSIDRPPTPATLRKRLQTHWLALANQSTMLIAQGQVFMNGELADPTPAPWLLRLAHDRCVQFSASELEHLEQNTLIALADWLDAGVVVLRKSP